MFFFNVVSSDLILFFVEFLQIMLSNQIEFAEVQYFFNASVNNARRTLALVSLYSRPDEDFFRRSNWTTVWSVTEGGPSSLQ